MRCIRLVYGNELREFFFKHLFLGPEPVYLSERLGENLPKGDAAISLYRLAQFIEVEEVFRLVEQRGNDDFLGTFNVAAFVAGAETPL